MIYDRTQSDVNEAVRIRKEKVQSFQELTEQEIETLERGTITINTLNRIEQKQKELVTVLNNMGYYGLTSLVNKEWAYSDVFDESNFRRILQNCEMLKTAFYVYLNTPAVPSAKYHYTNINSTEKILHDIDAMAEEIVSLYNICGAYVCGEGNE